MNLSNLPRDLIISLLINLDINDILTMCRTTNDFNQICDEDYLWRSKTNNDYPLYQSKPVNNSWKQTYIKLNRNIKIWISGVGMPGRYQYLTSITTFNQLIKASGYPIYGEISSIHVPQRYKPKY